MIENPFLPKSRVRAPCSSCASKRLFQQPDPPTQLEITSSAHKQMDMIGHNYVSAHGNIEILLGSPGKKNESRMDLVPRKASDSVMRAKSNEIERARIKDSTETGRAASKFFSHGNPVVTTLRRVGYFTTGHRPVATAKISLIRVVCVIRSLIFCNWCPSRNRWLNHGCLPKFASREFLLTFSVNAAITRAGS